ncbi:MAG: metallophosphoesterase [Deltaproteobacteria bacterium]|nr:metallophosphoesterase [Deltaproteobacteria bacterium]
MKDGLADPPQPLPSGGGRWHRAPRLFALSDLHVDHRDAFEALEALPAHPHDGLILAGDVGDSVASLERTLSLLAPRWARLFWVPGNHELWTVRRTGETDRGLARYENLLECCRAHGVLTPEDAYLEWPGARVARAGGDRPVAIAPTFTLYDYSFCPDGMTPSEARAWALADGIVASDEALLHPDPYPDRESWCAARLAATEPRLEERSRTHALVIVNHWPLRRDLVRIPRVPRYAPWCGTRRTEDWHIRFDAAVVVTGHLHVRATDVRDGVRFEEVSIGYPRDWDRSRGLERYLRRIL